nr:DUF1127 domain-containing protein [Pseudoruegeria sp. HB172150]
MFYEYLSPRAKPSRTVIRRKAGAPVQRRDLSQPRNIFEYFRFRREYRRLLDLPDYLLEDLGLDRGQVIVAMKRSYF